MGLKGDKHTSESALSAKVLTEKLAAIDGISSKKMFGGNGIFHDGSMFAMVDSKGRIFMKADPTELSGVGSSEKHGRMPYYALPADLDLTTDQWIEWAKRSMAINT